LAPLSTPNKITAPQRATQLDHSTSGTSALRTRFCLSH
jgi:hypothetical protein